MALCVTIGGVRPVMWPRPFTSMLPYVLYIDPIARGVLAESFSLGVFPLALWALDRLRRRATAGRG
jgi:hypothetical protein